MFDYYNRNKKEIGQAAVVACPILLRLYAKESVLTFGVMPIYRSKTYKNVTLLPISASPTISAVAAATENNNDRKDYDPCAVVIVKDVA